MNDPAGACGQETVVDPTEIDMTLKDIIESRRSISQFESREIPDAVIDGLIESAGYAPSSTDIQPWFFLVFRSEERKRQLNDFIRQGYEKTKERLTRNGRIIGPVFGTVLDVFSRYGEFDEAPVYMLVFARPYDKGGLAKMIRFSHDAGISAIAEESTKTSVAMAMQNLLLAAHDAGLGTRVKDGIKFFLTDSDLKARVYDEFSIPDDYTLLSGIQLGYPTDAARKRPSSKRRPLDAIRRFV